MGTVRIAIAIAAWTMMSLTVIIAYHNGTAIRSNPVMNIPAVMSPSVIAVIAALVARKRGEVGAAFVTTFLLLILLANGWFLGVVSADMATKSGWTIRRPPSWMTRDWPIWAEYPLAILALILACLSPRVPSHSEESRSET